MIIIIIIMLIASLNKTSSLYYNSRTSHPPHSLLPILPLV